MADTSNEKCAHENCTCAAAEGSRYCCPACEASKSSPGQACSCGHSGCKGALAAA